MEHITLIQNLLLRSEKLLAAKIESVEKLAGDASDRQFYRVALKESLIKSAVLMLVTKNIGPVASGDKMTQDRSFVEIGRELNSNRIPAVEIYADGIDQGAILVEDCGDTGLWQAALTGPATFASINDPARFYFKKGVELILQLQSVPRNDCIAFRRELAEQDYRTEAQRFIDFYLIPLNAGQETISQTWSLVSEVSSKLAALPKALTHRDYMPWNLHVVGEELKLFDYQDMLQAAPLYDLISLLHDRDIDFALGAEKVTALAREFRSKLNLQLDFAETYYLTLLQRNLRLAGQFRLLSEEKGRPKYRNWIPGCLFRIGWCLRSLGRAELLRDLSKVSSEIKRGSEDPNWLPL